MPSEIEKYTNAAHAIRSLYKETEMVMSDGISKWICNIEQDLTNHGSGIGELNFPDPPFKTRIIHIGEILENLLESDPKLFWTTGQKNLCLKLLKPINFETQKLKRKLDRLSTMISEQIKILTPLFTNFTDETYLAVIYEPADELNKRPTTLNKDSEEVERQVMKLMASETLNWTKKNGFIDKLKSTFPFGSLSTKKTKLLQNFQARLRKIEAEDKSLESCKAFISVDEMDTEKLMVTWGEEDDVHIAQFLQPSSLGTETGTRTETKSKSNDLVITKKKKILDEIMAEADIKYLRIALNANSNVDNNNDNILESNPTELRVLYQSPSSFCPTFTNSPGADTISDEVNANICNVKFPEDPFSYFKVLIKEARNIISEITFNIRMAERNFYTTPQYLLKTSTGISLELKNLIQIVKEAGIGLQEKFTRNERRRKNTFSREQIDLMKLLGDVYRSGISFWGELDTFREMVEIDSEHLESIIQIYRIDETPEETYQFDYVHQ